LLDIIMADGTAVSRKCGVFIRHLVRSATQLADGPRLVHTFILVGCDIPVIFVSDLLLDE
jgi:hypothetical protein